MTMIGVQWQLCNMQVAAEILPRAPDWSGLEGLSGGLCAFVKLESQGMFCALQHMYSFWGS